MSSRLKPLAVTATICLAVGAIATLTAARLHRRGGASAPGLAGETVETDVATRAEVAELRGQLAALRLNGAAAPAQPKTGGEAPEAASAPPAAANQPAAESTKAPDFEGDFRTESLDTSWSSAAEAKVATALRADDVKANVKSTECRARTCRVEIADAGPSNVLFAYLNLHLMADFPTAQITERVGADGRPETIFYFQRPDSAVR